MIDGFDNFEVVGRGGFSVVYSAREIYVDRVVAIKILHGVSTDSAMERDRFQREVRAMGRLSGIPNIVDVYRPVFTELGAPCIVMPYMAGGNLAQRLATSGPLPASTVRDLGLTLTTALAAAHSQGIYHRDIKPENVLLDAGGTPYLGDFGIALMDDLLPGSATAATLSPTHAPPERFASSARPATADAVGDVYSLGSTLYTVLAGHPPFGDPRSFGALEFQLRVVDTSAPPLPRSDVPIALETLILRCLAKNPGQRPTAAQVVAELTELRVPQDTLELEDATVEREATGWTGSPRGDEATAPTVRRERSDEEAHQVRSLPVVSGEEPAIRASDLGAEEISLAGTGRRRGQYLRWVVLAAVGMLGVAGLALLTGVVLGLIAAPSGELLLADAPDPQGEVTDIAIYSVEPGDEADDSAIVARSVRSPLDIVTEAEYGQSWVNSLGRVWDGSVLLAYGNGEANVVTAGNPGEEQAELARSPQARTTVLDSGVFVQTAEGCVLATSADALDQVGVGNCTISSDERWVASWPTTGEGLTIRDLRDDSTEEVPDLVVGNAAALSAGARVMVIDRVADGFQGVVIDATNGEEIGRTESYDFLDVPALEAEAEGFVLQTATEEGTALIYVDTDGEATQIDSGFYLVPVLNGSKVTYLNYGEDLADSTLRRWTPGDGESTSEAESKSEELLSGFIGAVSPDGEYVLATRETPAGTEIWREEHGTGDMAEALVLPRAADDADPSAGIDPTVGSGTGVGITQMQVKGKTVHLQVDGATTGSYVRIDTVGDDSDAPITGAPGLLFESLDADGTALLTRPVPPADGTADDSAADDSAGDGGASESDGTDGEADSERTEILVVRPHDDEPDVRATVGSTATNLIHEGVIYLTRTDDPAQVTVSSLRALGGDDSIEELYVNKQIAGATWPQWGGATRSVFITPRLLIEQAQQQQANETAEEDP